MDRLWEHIDRLSDMLVIAVPLVLWAVRWMRRIEVSIGFTKSVAKEHLPHVYWRLRRSDDVLKLPVVEHPSIVYLNGGPNGVSTSEATSKPA